LGFHPYCVVAQKFQFYFHFQAALNNYTAVISKVHKDSNIIVISICPGPIYKDVTGSSLHPGISLDESAAEIINTITKLNIEDTGKFMIDLEL
jgi:NAD(P)-dependent dehydrogenase (short-subunit alcohol dehydrogenase family)